MKRSIFLAALVSANPGHQDAWLQNQPINRKEGVQKTQYGQDPPSERRINTYPTPRKYECFSKCHPDVTAAGNCADTSCDFCPWPYKYVAGDPDSHTDNDRCEERHLCERIRWYSNRNKYMNIVIRGAHDKKIKRCPMGFSHRPMWYGTETTGSNQQELCCKKECYSREHKVTQPCTEADNVLLSTPFKQFWQMAGNSPLQCTYKICDLLGWGNSEEGADFCCADPNAPKLEKMPWLTIDHSKVSGGVKRANRKSNHANHINLANYRK